MGKRGKKKKPKRRTAPKRPSFKRIEIPLPELKAIVQRAAAGPLSLEDRDNLDAAINSLAFLTSEIEAKGASIRRLRQLIFGSSTEKTSSVCGKNSADSGEGQDGPPTEAGGGKADGNGGEENKSRKRKGHGRNPAAAYRGADKATVAHPTLRHGDPCPECPKGKVYRLPKPAALVRVVGMAPLSATVYELERLRCKLCGKVFTAPAPSGVGEAKYDETAASMIGLLKYGCGLPFNRLERLERDLGIPLPASTQWEVVNQAASLLKPAHEELIRQAAQGTVLHNDDTTMKILDLEKRRKEAAPGKEANTRTGMFTSGIVAVGDGHQIALFFSGCRHAGENLEAVLARRASSLPLPIQMSDALPANRTGDFDTIIASCIAHARRRFVDVADNFPDECRRVLEAFRKVYRNEARIRQLNMSAEDRMRTHQEKSGPVMENLQKWLRAQFDARKVEPNSGLGEAIAYMLKHWEPLTLFLRAPGAPLDNNICERVLKRAILHRKNALFYKTQNGADAGDLFMSLIHTAELCNAETFDYLTALQRHSKDVARHPAAWMPWNYKARITSLDTSRAQ